MQEATVISLLYLKFVILNHIIFQPKFMIRIIFVDVDAWILKRIQRVAEIIFPYIQEGRVQKFS